MNIFEYLEQTPIPTKMKEILALCNALEAELRAGGARLMIDFNGQSFAWAEFEKISWEPIAGWERYHEERSRLEAGAMLSSAQRFDREQSTTKNHGESV
jgi:hypothetical protein